MSDTRPALGRDPAYDGFLGASVGEDGKGANVTMLSMLARLGVDPWDEASDLAAMADAPARKRLIALFGRFKDVPERVADQGEMVRGLLAALPRKSGPVILTGGNPIGVYRLPRVGVPFYWVMLIALFIGWVIMLAGVR